MRRQRAGSLGNSYQRVSCPAGSGIWKLPNLTTAFLSKNQKYVNQLWRIKTAEPSFRSQWQTTSLAIVPHKEQTARNFTMTSCQLYERGMRKGVGYLFGKHSAGISLSSPLPFSSLFLSLSFFPLSWFLSLSIPSILWLQKQNQWQPQSFQILITELSIIY